MADDVLSIDETLRTLRWAVDGGGFEDAAQTEVVSRSALHHLAEVERLRELLTEAVHYLDSCGCDDDECPGRQKAAQLRAALTNSAGGDSE